jgi:hypothetical protein
MTALPGSPIFDFASPSTDPRSAIGAPSSPLLTRRFPGLQPYEPMWRAMQAFTDARGAETPDELWIVEHERVFTLGQAGKWEHVLLPGDIPVVPVDRGGQVTYHGPGQIVAYPVPPHQSLRFPGPASDAGARLGRSFAAGGRRICTRGRAGAPVRPARAAHATRYFRRWPAGRAGC